MQLVDITLDGEPIVAKTSTSRFDLSVVVPTLNEKTNIPILYRSLSTVLAGIRWELIVVDDNSTDGSADLLVQMANEKENFRFIRRFGRFGVSTACVEGMLTSAASCIAVMDADGQHDETRLMEMFALLDSGAADVAVGSRFAEGADLTTFTKFRTNLSLYSNVMAQKWFDIPLKDSMGNFFMVKREVIEQAAPKLCGRGQKLLFDIILVSPKDLKVAEVPIVFGSREHGESKLSHIAAIDFGLQMWDRKFGSIIPTKVLVDLSMILGFSTLMTLLIWSYMKIAFAVTGHFPYAPNLVPLAAIPSVFIAFYTHQSIIHKRRRSKGLAKLGELATFFAISLPFIVLSAWVTASAVGIGDPRLRHLFGAALVCSIGIVMATNWRKEFLSKRS